ncbi:hypothetical protein [Streptomyces sp. NPDC086023]|uniref:hypothetical protein n=1 Tax=Streptomyces sp. NPDC086023 TaxID=3365746 RepID=UPI0037CFBCBB
MPREVRARLRRALGAAAGLLLLLGTAVAVAPVAHAAPALPPGTYVFTANFGDQSVSAVNAATNTVVEKYPVFGQPVSVAYTAAGGGYVCAASTSTNTVTVINTHANVSNQYVHFSSPVTAVAAHGNYCYVTNGVYLSRFDVTATNLSATSVPVAGSLTALAVSQTGSTVTVYAAAPDLDRLYSFDASGATMSQTSLLTGLSEPTSVAVSPDGARVYIGGLISVAYVSAQQPLSQQRPSFVNIGGTLDSVAVSADSSLVYAVDNQAGQLRVINAAATPPSLANSIGIPLPTGVAAHSANNVNYAYVTHAVNLVSGYATSPTAPPVASGSVNLGAGTEPAGLAVGTVGLGAPEPLRPVLTLTKSPAGPFVRGREATYTLVVSNTGTRSTTGRVSVTDTLPAGLTPLAFSGAGWDCTTSPLTCSRSDELGAHSSFPELTLTVKVARSAPVTVTNSAVVTSTEDHCRSTATATVTVTGKHHPHKRKPRAQQPPAEEPVV